MDRTAANDDYERMAKAIQFIDDHHSDQPELADIAGHLDLSPAHFQRMFSRWVGVSPKTYVQYLTLDHAKRLLNERESVLDAALGSGLSGPGRLHDLMIKWEAMTPGEYARGAGTLSMFYGSGPSPFGEALVVGTARGICGLAFTAQTGAEASLADMKSRWPDAEFKEDLAAANAALSSIFGSKGEIEVLMIGAPFQIKVWEALMAVPTGEVATYSSLAERVGNPKAVRAVGTAVGRNPVSWLIPCHRALRKSGALGGYHWGLPVKRAMLAYEAARYDAQIDRA